jgi:hypothetical protein
VVARSDSAARRAIGIQSGRRSSTAAGQRASLAAS